MVMVTGPNDDDDDDDAVTYRFWSVLCSMLLSTGLTACNMLEMKCDYAHPAVRLNKPSCNAPDTKHPTL